MHKKLFYSFWIVFLCSTCVAPAQKSNLQDSIRPKEFSVRNMFHEGLHGQAIIWTKPVHIHQQDWKFIVPAAILLGSSFALDHEIYNSVQDVKQRNPELHDIAQVATKFGEGIVPIGITCAFAAGGLIFKDNRALRTGVLAAEALVHSAILGYAMKASLGRARPTTEAKDGKLGFFEEFNDETKHNSFPSGHTIIAFTLATVVATEYSNTIWVPVVCYSAATACGLSRIVLEKHWTSDVLMASMLGYAIGRMTVKEHNRHWNISPFVNSSGAAGIGFHTSF
ncbi:hypothetical protein BH11BAC2_BH11BAC2_12190 [soil metagenome]